MKVNEVFYSLQGEGRYTGVAAVFVRLSGCNMRCSFCDTDHENGVEMTEEEIVRKACEYPARHIVITGGEPTLQLTGSLVDRLHEAGFYVQIETNGTRRLAKDCRVDWVTCSPKGAAVKLERIDELKVVYQGQDMAEYDHLEAKEYRLQPLDTQNEEENKRIVAATIAYCQANPKWSLSLQTHKMTGIR